MHFDKGMQTFMSIHLAKNWVYKAKKRQTMYSSSSQIREGAGHANKVSETMRNFTMSSHKLWKVVDFILILQMRKIKAWGGKVTCPGSPSLSVEEPGLNWILSSGSWGLILFLYHDSTSHPLLVGHDGRNTPLPCDCKFKEKEQVFKDCPSQRSTLPNSRTIRQFTFWVVFQSTWT